MLKTVISVLYSDNCLIMNSSNSFKTTTYTHTHTQIHKQTQINRLNKLNTSPREENPQTHTDERNVSLCGFLMWWWNASNCSITHSLTLHVLLQVSLTTDGGSQGKVQRPSKQTERYTHTHTHIHTHCLWDMFRWVCRAEGRPFVKSSSSHLESFMKTFNKSIFLHTLLEGIAHSS